MKQTNFIMIRTIFGVMLGIVCLASAPAMAAEPAWWTQQKRDCNLPSNLAYNNWGGECNSPSGNSSPAPSYNNAAAQQAQAAAAAVAAAEKERQEEAERKRQAEINHQAEFIRNRDAGASTLKGSSSSALNQLKGLSGSGSSGLKGSGFDTGSHGLKELRGSDPVDKKVSSLPETTPASKEVCQPSQNPAVVDLCFLEDRPAVIDPLILKGMNPAERTAFKTSVQNMMGNLLPFDKEIYQAIAEVGTDPAKSGTQWPGPKNPGARYLNPLSEPEQVKAYWDTVNAGLQAHADAEAKIVTATRKSSGQSHAFPRMQADPKFDKAIEQIRRNQDKAEGLATNKTVIKLSEFLEKQGGADWSERIKNDKLFAARVVMERDDLLKKMDQEISRARVKALQEITVLVREWK